MSTSSNDSSRSGDDEAPPRAGEALTVDQGNRGLEAEFLLQRAKQKLLGHQPTPVVIGRYRVLDRIGEGGMGVVYVAHDDELDRRVAVKVMRPDVGPGTEGRARVFREAQAMAKLSHPNVVHVYEVGRHRGQVFVAMEYVPGQTLREWNKARKRSWREILAVFIQAGRALEAAHEAGMIHRDFKPDNVMVDEAGRVRVLDFGLAHAIGEAAPARDGQADSPSSSSRLATPVTVTGAVLGTVAYMAPEQHAGAVTGARADQFSFCVALFEALYGVRPFERVGDKMVFRLDEVDPGTEGVPEPMHAALLRGLSREPRERFGSMAELLAALEPRRRPLRSGSRKAVAWVLPVLVLALAVVAVIGWLREDMSGSGERDGVQDAWAEVVAASELPPTIDEPLAHDPLAVTIHRLRNGLTVYISPRRDAARIHARIVTRVGYPHESGKRGVAHLLMRLLNNGTDRLGTLDFEAERAHFELRDRLLAELETTSDAARRHELVSRLEASYRTTAPVLVPSEHDQLLFDIGAKLTAFWQEELTMFAADIPSPRLEVWARLERERVRAPVFRGLLPEAARVINDSRARLDGADAGQWAVAEALAPSTGQWLSPAVEARDVATLPLAEVRELFATYFVPNNTALVLVGDVDARTALPLLEQVFGDWEPKTLPRIDPGTGVVAGGRKLLEVVGTGPDKLVLGWPLPAGDAVDRREIELLAGILGAGNGLLQTRIVARGLAASAEVTLGDRTMVVVLGIPPGGEMEGLETAVLELFEALERDELTEEEWAAARARHELEQRQQIGSGEDAAELISRSFGRKRSWAPIAAALGGQWQPTREQMAAAAKAMRARGHAVVLQTAGDYQPPSLDTLDTAPLEIEPGRRSELASKLAALPTTQLQPQFFSPGRDYETTRRGSGVVISAPRTDGLFEMELRYRRGARDDPLLCDALHALFDAVADEARAQLPGAEVSVSCGATWSSVYVSGLERELEPALTMVERWLRDPAMTNERVEGYKPRALERRRAARQRSEEVASALHDFAARGRYSVHELVADDGELSQATAGAFREALVKLVAHDPDVLYAGAQPDRLRALLPAGVELAEAPWTSLDFRDSDGPSVFLFDEPGRDHADLQVTCRVPALAATEFVLVDVHRTFLDALLRAQLERLRAIRPPSIRWSADRDAPVSPAAVSVRLQVPTEMAIEAIEAVRSALAVLPTPEQAEAAAAAVEEQYRTSRVSGPAVTRLVRHWSRRGLTSDPRVEWWNDLVRLERARLVEFASRIRKAEPVISMAADLEKVDPSALARLGKARRVTADRVLRDPYR